MSGARGRAPAHEKLSGTLAWQGTSLLRAPARRRAAPPAAAAESTTEWVKLDPLIHERTRLAILSALSTSPEGALSFLGLRDTLHLTDGNLLAHLRTLESAGRVELMKKGAGRGSSTVVQLTASGRKAFHAYLDQLEFLVRVYRRPEGVRTPARETHLPHRTKGF